MVFSKALWSAAAALAMTACATADGAPARAGSPDVSVDEKASLPTAEEIAAMETLSGVEYPPFADEIVDYCKRNLPSMTDLVGYVEGYADERLCINPANCADAVVRYGYSFVEIEARIGVGEQGLTPGKYHITLAEPGDRHCGPFERHIKSEQERNPSRRGMAAAPEGTCVAFRPIQDFTAPYIVKDVQSNSSRFEKAALRRFETLIIERVSGAVVARAGNLRVGVSSVEPEWGLSCSSQGPELLNQVIPPVRD